MPIRNLVVFTAALASSCLQVAPSQDAGSPAFDAGDADAGTADSGLSLHDGGAGDAGPGSDAGRRDAGNPVNGDGGWPAWRQAMQNATTLYPVMTDPWNSLAASLTWPGGVWPETMYGGAFDFIGAIRDVHSGYGSGLYLDDVGPFGTLVYTGTGENVFGEQMTAIAISADAPVWAWWQLPGFPLSDAEATATDSDWWYDVSGTTYAAIPANRRIGNDFAMAPGWDGQFPVAYQPNWVLRRKARLTLLGGRPHKARYHMPCYVPASMTGTGTGAILINQEGFAGPYQGKDGMPRGVTASQYLADVDENGQQKFFIHAMNVTTKEWSRLPAWHLTVQDNTYAWVDDPYPFVDRAAKRVYYHALGKSYFVDLSAGLTAATTSPITQHTLVGADFSPDFSFGMVSLEADPHGRRLQYLKVSGSNEVVLVDLTGHTLFRLQLSGLSINGRGGMSYDPGRERVYVVWNDAGTPRFAWWAVPPGQPGEGGANDPTVQSNYTVTTETLQLGPGVTGVDSNYLYGKRTVYVPTLDVVLWTQNDLPLMAFRPP